MKRLFFTFLALGMFTVFMSSVLGETDSFDFRNSNWGDSYQKVLETENAEPFIKDPRMVSYRTTFETFKCMAMFAFKNDQLAEGAYLFIQQHNNGAEYLDDYNRVKNQLIVRYGLPFKSEDNWPDHTTDDTAKQGKTKAGFFANSAEWRSDRTHVVLTLVNNKGSINMYMTYSSIMNQPESTPKPKNKKRDKSSEFLN